jgi:hypothetical protein
MTFDDDLFLCLECVKENRLRAYATSHLKLENKKCFICKTIRPSFPISKSNELNQVFKALIRYYFTEDQYNGHWGGDNVETLFASENPILNHNIVQENADDSDEVHIEDAVSELIGSGYENYDEGVSIYKGQDYGYFHLTVADEASHFYTELLQDLKSNNHYVVEPKAINFIEKFKDKITKIVPKGSEFFRARIGVQKEKIKHLDSGLEFENIVFPHYGKDIGAPPPINAANGRLNRLGVSFLYLADDLYTAISEIKPYPGQTISSGKFISNKDLKFADFKDFKYDDFWYNDEQISHYVFIKTLNEILSTPIEPNQATIGYQGTQFISNVIRLLGFDGILFKSSLSTGVNYVAFDPQQFSFLPDSTQCVKVKSVKYEYGPVKFEIKQEQKEGVWYYPDN